MTIGIYSPKFGLIANTLEARASKSTGEVLPKTASHRHRIGTRAPSKPQAADRDYCQRLLPLLHVLAAMGIRHCLAARRQYGAVQLFPPLAEIFKKSGRHQDVFCGVAQLHPHCWPSHPARGRGPLQWCQRLFSQKTPLLATPFCDQHHVSGDTHYPARHSCHLFCWIFPQLCWSVSRNQYLVSRKCFDPF